MIIYGKVMILTAFLCCTTIVDAKDFTIPDKLLDSCVFVMRGDKAIGTGFILHLSDTNGYSTYLITAKHVVEHLRNTTEPLALRFNKRDTNETSTVAFPIVVYKGKRWFEHPNPAIDLAVFPLPVLYDSLGLRLGLMPVDSPTNEFLATADWLQNYSVGPGDSVFTLGMVPYLLLSERNLVIARFGRIAMLSQSEINLPNGHQKAYFLDCATFPGNSGGPAFVQIDRTANKDPLFLGWRFALLGVVTEFVPSPMREAEVTLQESAKQKVTIGLENTGISKVVPVDYIVDILFSTEIQESRNALAQMQREQEEKNAAQEKDAKTPQP